MKNRIQSIDLLRGIVMVIMALDHTRDMFHSPAFVYDPLDLSKTYPLLFFTRWITHYCAPIFVFLAGTSIFLQSLRKTKKELSTFLIKRGLWLIFIEVTVITLGMTFNIYYNTIVLQVIWAIGVSMVFLGAFIWLPFNLILACALLIVFGHNTLDYLQINPYGVSGLFWNLLHHQQRMQYGNHSLFILYPFLPWLGLMLLGFCFGKLYEPGFEQGRRKKLLLLAGLGTILLFIIVRYINTYGDPNPWSPQKNILFTVMSFIKTHKYPPSLLYMCMTIGPALIFLAWSENARNKITEIFLVYGRVPFLYYILHFYILHTIRAILFIEQQGYTLSEGIHGVKGVNSPFRFQVSGNGYHLWVVYVVWISVVIALYPVCKWFSQYKMTHKNWWLSYL